MKLKIAQKGLDICDNLVGFNFAEGDQIERLRDIFEKEIKRCEGARRKQKRKAARICCGCKRGGGFIQTFMGAPWHHYCYMTKDTA